MKKIISLFIVISILFTPAIFAVDENFTLIPSPNCSISTVVEGGKIFTDRTYTFSGLPSELYGAKHVQSPINVSFARAQGEGWVYVITPTDGSSQSIASFLVALGFDKVNVPSFKAWSADPVLNAVYSKYVYNGDMIEYGARGITLFSKTPLFASLELPLAIIEPSSGASISKIQTGKPVFSDSAQTFDSLPTEFLGQGYINASINGGIVGTVKEAGNVYVIAPTGGDNAQETALISAGYEKTTIQHFNVFAGLTETVGVFKKYLQKNETVTYSKWQIVVCSPFTANGIFYPSLEPTSLFLDVPYRYKKENRVWQGLGDIERASNGRLWVTWYSGGTKEPHKDNYAILGTSDDNGATWTEPVLVLDNLSDYGRVLDPTLWIDPTGKMWLFYNQLNSLETFEPYMGVWAITTENPEDPNPTWTEPKRIFSGFKRNKPIILSSGEWMMPIYDWMEEKTAKVYISTDQGETWTCQGGAVTGQYSFDEQMVVEKNDGSLWMLMRTSFGIGQSFSYDKGKTWTAMTNSGIAGPSSRFHIRRLPSGNLLLINHYNFTARDHMTALLSTDDGATWPYKLLLDERSNVTYPDATVTEDGTIYSVYDRERIGASEVLMAVFNEEDIMSGAFVSDVAQQKTVVTRLMSEKTKWDFSEGSDMWKPTSKSLSFDTGTAGILTVNILGTDAYMMNSVSFPSSYNKIKLRMKNATSSPNFQVFFGTSKNPGIVGTRKKDFILEKDMTEYKDFILDVGSMADWSDTITSLRLDVADSATSGTVYIDSIEMIKDYKENWNFAESAEGWLAQNKLTFDEPINGELGINIASSDAYIYNPNTDIDGANKKIRVRMKNTTNSAVLQVYFTTNSVATMGESTGKSFTTKTNMSEYEDFVFDMSGITTWKGIIKSLRLDLADTATSGKVYIDSIEVYSDFDVRLSKNGVETNNKKEADKVSLKISEFMDDEITPVLAVYKISDNSLVNCIVGQKGQKEISVGSISSKYIVKLLCLNDLKSIKPLAKIKTIYDGATFTLVPSTAGAGVLPVRDGQVIFTDRIYTLSNLPSGLYGAEFIKAPITGVSATADGEGWVYVITPDPATSPTVSISSTLLANGFTKVNIDGFKLWSGGPDTCLLYSKYVKNAEALTYPKWGVILFSKTNLFLFNTLEAKIAEAQGYKENLYSPESFAVLSSKIALAQQLLVRGNATLIEINQAIIYLDSAIAGLKYISVELPDNQYQEVFNEGFETALTAEKRAADWIIPFPSNAYMFAGDSLAKVKWASDGVAGNGSVLAKSGIYQNYKLETNLKVVTFGIHATLSLRNPENLIYQQRAGDSTNRPGAEGIMIVLGGTGIASDEFAVVFKNGQLEISGLQTKAEYKIKYPAGVNITQNTNITVYDLDNVVYIYIGGTFAAKIELRGLSGENYTQGSVYNANYTLVGTPFSGMVIKRSGHIAYGVRTGSMEVDDIKISTLL